MKYAYHQISAEGHKARLHAAMDALAEAGKRFISNTVEVGAEHWDCPQRVDPDRILRTIGRLVFEAEKEGSCFPDTLVAIAGMSALLYMRAMDENGTPVDTREWRIE